MEIYIKLYLFKKKLLMSLRYFPFLTFTKNQTATTFFFPESMNYGLSCGVKLSSCDINFCEIKFLK